MVQGHRRFGSIGSYLVGLVALQMVLVLGLVAWAGQQDLRKARIDAVASMTTTAKAASHFLAEDMQSNVDSLKSLPDLLKTFTVAQICADVQQTANAPIDDRWSVTDIHIVKPDGSPACTEQRTQRNVASQSWFKEAVASSDVATVGPTVDSITGKRSLIFSVASPEHHVVIGIAARLETTGKALDAQFGSAAHPVEFVVVSSDRKTQIASTDKIVNSLAGTGFSKRASASRNEFVDANGVQRFWAEASVRDFGWHVYAGVTKADAFSAAHRDLKERAALAAAFLILVLVAAGVIQRRIVRPIHALGKATRRVTKGDFDAPVRPDGPVELIELAEGFNTMVGVRAEAETKLRKAVETEQRAVNELREVDQMRNAFLMAISHELRTPLTSVVGFSTMLQSDRGTMSDADVGRCIDAVASQSRRLEKLLLDLLDIDRMGRGVLEPNRKDVDVRDLINGVVERSAQRDRITAKIAKATRGYVDPALIERIVENLINNAIKHTPADSRIWVGAKRTNGSLEIVVDDNGAGIPDDLKDRVFEPFDQGNKGEHVSGTGVGLTLVKQFAKLQGGDAWVEDRRGGGSSFRVVLPATERRRRLKKAS